MDIDCTVKKSDIEDLVRAISIKLLSDRVIRNYLERMDESFSVSDNQLLVEWAIDEYEDEKGRFCVDLGYIPVSTLLDSIDEKDYVSVCQRLVVDVERIYYDAYHALNSGAFPVDFMIDKVRRLKFVI